VVPETREFLVSGSDAPGASDEYLPDEYLFVWGRVPSTKWRVPADEEAARVAYAMCLISTRRYEVRRGREPRRPRCCDVCRTRVRVQSR
jgi:hypothetical protein